MHKPGILLTGKKAGDWYIQTLEGIKTERPSFDYEALQVDFEPINALLPRNMEAAARRLEPYFAEMENRRQPYILANITLHEAVQYFSLSPKYFISIEEILQKETKSIEGTVAILGTRYTMNHTYFSSLLPNTTIITLAEHLQDAVDALRSSYYHVSNKVMAAAVFDSLKQLKIDHYILACTELAVALEDSKLDLNAVHIPKMQCDYLIGTSWNRNAY